VTSAVGETAVDLTRLVAIAMNDGLTVAPRRPSRFNSLVLRDGSLITASEVTLREGRLVIEAEAGFTLTVDPAEVRRLDCYGERVRPLTAVEPASFDLTPYLSRPAGYEVDRNIREGTLVLDGTPAGTGIGVSTSSRLTYELEGEFRAFHVTIGLDDDAGDRGSVLFSVLGDGRELFRSSVLRRSDAAVEVGPLDVAGVRILALIADFRDSGDVQDVADWVRPTLLK
jgi:hypothetical protein